MVSIKEHRCLCLYEQLVYYKLCILTCSYSYTERINYSNVGLVEHNTCIEKETFLFSANQICLNFPSFETKF
jgi:hypothetical protein